jgi:hypothetical protein
MRVLGALEYAEGDTKLARYKAVSQMTFTDECGKSHQFSHKTIESWWYYYQRNGVTDHTGRSDKGTSRKVHPEYLLEAIEQVLPSFHGKKYNIAEIYRACIQRGLLQGTRIGAAILIGADCRIGKNARVGERVFIGDGAAVSANAVIPDGAVIK